MFVPDRFRIWGNEKKITEVISYKSLAFSFYQVLIMYGKNESYIKFQYRYVVFIAVCEKSTKKVSILLHCVFDL